MSVINVGTGKLKGIPSIWRKNSELSESEPGKALETTKNLNPHGHIFFPYPTKIA